jgi:hypothetical protein
MSRKRSWPGALARRDCAVPPASHDAKPSTAGSLRSRIPFHLPSRKPRPLRTLSRKPRLARRWPNGMGVLARLSGTFPCPALAAPGEGPGSRPPRPEGPQLGEAELARLRRRQRPWPGTRMGGLGVSIKTTWLSPRAAPLASRAGAPSVWDEPRERGRRSAAIRNVEMGSLCGARAWSFAGPRGSAFAGRDVASKYRLGSGRLTVSSDGLPSRTITMRASLDLSGPVREASIVLLPRRLGI